MNVRDIDFSEDFLVYASPAGIVEYDFQNNNYKTISFDDGISFGKIKKFTLILRVIIGLRHQTKFRFGLLNPPA